LLDEAFLIFEWTVVNFILRVKQSFEDEGTMILQNVGNYHTVTQITLQMA